MEGQGTMKMSRNVVIPKLTCEEEDDNSDVMVVDADGNTKESEVEMKKVESEEKNKKEIKNDWMIPIEFQSDISHIHQKAGFTTVGL